MNLLLGVAKSLGLFAVSRRIYRKRLNILCYHGFSVADEHAFRPKLFMTAATFARRLDFLAREGYAVVTLDEALHRLARGQSNLRDVVITIDDGFGSVLGIAAPLLRAHGFPATLYVTSYYSQHAKPVFRLAVRYMFWKTLVTELACGELLACWGGQGLARADDALCERLVQYGEAELDEQGRFRLLDVLGRATGVSLDWIVDSRCLSLLDAAELGRLSDFGIDIQLHTHRHRFPFEDEALTDEIVRNQEFLAACAGTHGKHLCYPSGHWHSDFWPVLRRCGVVSATTCDPGLNDAATPSLSLCRFLDGEHLSELQFEAELCGYKQLLRDAAMLARGRLPLAMRNWLRQRRSAGRDMTAGVADAEPAGLSATHGEGTAPYVHSGVEPFPAAVLTQRGVVPPESRPAGR
jgi:peptidoglycan/xylan/chitin deacetylase (PgdA/CDA1 family)